MAIDTLLQRLTPSSRTYHPLRNLDVRDLPDMRTDLSVVKGEIAEFYVHSWLERAGANLDVDIPRDLGDDLRLRETGKGPGIYRGSEVLREYDGLFYFDGTPFAVEVKSWKLNGIAGKLRQEAENGFLQNLYPGHDPLMFLFIPATFPKKREQLGQLEREFPFLRFVNTNYLKKDLLGKVNEYKRYKLRQKKVKTKIISKNKRRRR